MQRTVERMCGRNTTIFLSPDTVGYDVVHYGQTCGGAGPSFEEIRLKSKEHPRKQKTVFRYRFAQGLAASDRDVLPHIRWTGPRDVEINVRHVTDIAYRYGKAGDVNIHYGLQGHDTSAPAARDWRETVWSGSGWREITNEPNAVYIDGE